MAERDYEQGKDEDCKPEEIEAEEEMKGDWLEPDEYVAPARPDYVSQRIGNVRPEDLTGAVYDMDDDERDRARDDASELNAHIGPEGGPEGERRPDGQIRNEINEGLARHGWLDASEINVDVHDGRVTLTGMVTGQQEKQLAGDIADTAHGVVDVRNELRVGQPRQGQRPPEQEPGGEGPQPPRAEVTTGMNVVGSDGLPVGVVAETRNGDFKVSRPDGPDIYVPDSARKEIYGHELQLNIPAGLVDSQGWPTA